MVGIVLRSLAGLQTFQRAHELCVLPARNLSSARKHLVSAFSFAACGNRLGHPTPLTHPIRSTPQFSRAVVPVRSRSCPQAKRRRSSWGFFSSSHSVHPKFRSISTTAVPITLKSRCRPLSRVCGGSISREIQAAVMSPFRVTAALR